MSHPPRVRNTYRDGGTGGKFATKAVAASVTGPSRPVFWEDAIGASATAIVRVVATELAGRKCRNSRGSCQAVPMNDAGQADGNTWEKQIGEEGAFHRREAVFREHISNSARFAAESGRYHLYVSLACPWAHRTLIVRELKGLASHVSVNVSDWFLPSEGWTFTAKDEHSTLDTVCGERRLRDIYYRANPAYQGSVTVPALWDRRHMTIVNNESAEIIRMFNSELNTIAERPQVDLYPEELRNEIDAINAWVYPGINDGVYRCGFARTQSAYDQAVRSLFDALDRAEALLTKRRYLAGDRFTEADVRLFTTLIRFDVVYATHFKCNIRRIVDYPSLWGFTRELFAHPAFCGTTDFAHIKGHYFESHTSLNPQRIVPAGPLLDYSVPHGRSHLPAAWFPEP